ncbi:MAG TPA: exonuclease subunit SbcD, partial [Gammaproteobacteria bacterium]|nr:exonuclease subunit SbcD [Gammaproteobacteria bacterium]
GNHDSVAVLEESRELLACLNCRVIPGVEADPSQHVILLQDRQQQPAAVVCAIPYIRPRDVMTSQAGQSGAEKRISLQQAISTHYQAVFEQAEQRRRQLDIDVPIIATGHLMTVGASSSDSVRDLYIGTLDAFPANAFPPADYIALGHIHRPQVVAKSGHIRYSGSPIPLSFDELGQAKSVVMVDFDAAKVSKIKLLEVPVFQPMQQIKGDLEQIEATLETLRDASETIWLDIEVSSQDYLNDLQRRIDHLTADLPVEVLLLRRARRERHAIESVHKETLNELSVFDVFERRLAQENFESEAQQARLLRIQQSFSNVVEELKQVSPE